MDKEEIIEKYYHFKIKTADGIELDLIETKYYKELLDLYKQEKEKNKELEREILKRQWVKVDENGNIEPVFYISKDKIKEKIENETINISGFRCIAVEDIENLLEEK